jgi:hypothetical protein
MLGSDITVAMVNAEAQLDAHRVDRTLTVLLGGGRADVLAAIPILLPTLDTLADAVTSSMTVELTLGASQ